MASLKRRRSRFAIVGLVSLAMLVIFIQPASAVHDAQTIELDTGTNGANLVDNVAGNNPSDWASVFDSSGNTVQAGLPSGTIPSAVFFAADGGKDSTYHTSSDQDPMPINAAGGSNVWGCTTSNNPTGKDDILDGYALAARVQSGVGAPSTDVGDLIVNVGAERYANTGSAFWGVWLFHNQVGCTAKGAFSGGKSDGDVLIVIDFNNGGGSVDITAAKWHPCNAGPNPVSGCDPTSDDGYFTAAGQGGDCAAAPTSDDMCATVNRAALSTPWSAQAKGEPANTLDISEFFEAGFNLTDLFGSGTPGNEPCVGSLMIETRSAPQLETADDKDYVLHSFNTCVNVTAHKYEDKNANGTEDAGDAPLQNWRLFIDKNNNGTYESGTDVSPALTDANGNVTFANVQGGQSLRICEVLQSGWVNSDPNGGTPADPDGPPAGTNAVCQTKVAGSAGVAKFGNYRPASLSGVKFEDDNNNGTKDSGEPGIGGVEIHLFGTDGAGNAVHLHALTANTTGAFSFTNLVPGSYTLCESIPANFSQTYPTASTPGTTTCNHAAGGGTPPGVNAATGRGWGPITLLSGSVSNNNFSFDFGNAPEHRIIVLVCHQATNTLVGASVTIGSETHTSDTAVPTTGWSGNGKGVTQADLCTLGGAQFDNKPHGSQSATVTIPSSGAGSGH